MHLINSQHRAREDEVEKDNNQMKRVDPLIMSMAEIIEITEIVLEDMIEMNIDLTEIKDRSNIRGEEEATSVVHRIQSSYSLGLMMALRSRRKKLMMWQTTLMRGRGQK